MSATTDEIRALFIHFFVQRGHTLLPNTSLIPDDDTVLFTIAGVQQVQPFFMGLAAPPSRRLVNVQRCLRTVDIDEVGDDSHLTLFEMLGNWSVGDYFKREAVHWAWDLIAQAGFPLDRVWVTVYRADDGSTQDDETYALWREVGVPAERIVYLGAADNWWAPGDTGPCGPDTEIFYDRGAAFGCGRADCAPGCDCPRFLEFWNNVLTQYYRDEHGTLTTLEHKNVDTGAGLERWAMLLQEKGSVFETDRFWPLIESVAAVVGDGTLARYGTEAALTRSLRIIADHGRALTFLIFDGVTPGPKGRGSVLRRLLRRAVLHGRLLGLTQPFLARTVIPAVIETMRASYPDLPARHPYIAQIADAEERQFLQTLERGLPLAQQLIDGAGETKVVDGTAVYNLLQMRGFPLEIVQEMAAGYGLTIDTAGYERAEAEHRDGSRGGGGDYDAKTRYNRAYGVIAEDLRRPSTFVGYDTLVAHGRVVGIVDGERATAVEEAQQGDAVQVVLDTTPFYAESGGQAGDAGTLRVGESIVEVTGTQRPRGSALIVHWGTVRSGTLHVGDEVNAQVDPEARLDAARHHSATHLAHRALKDTLGEDVHQEGSVVAPERFTFDFNLPRPMTAAEISAVEGQVNRLIRADLPVETAVLPYAEAVATGAMALFSEKYGDTVRVVTMGLSRELCGGTHTARTGEIGLFLVLSESGVSAGVRRIECVAGAPAYRYTRGVVDELRGLARELDTQPGQVTARVAALRDAHRALDRQLAAAKQKVANLKTQAMLGTAGPDGSGAGDDGPAQADGYRYMVRRVDAGSLDELESQSDALKSRLAPSCVVVLGAAMDGRAAFTAAVTRDVADKGVRAGDLVKAATTAAGGKGGGNPTWAKGSAPDAGKVDAGLDAARALLRPGGA